MNIEKFLTKEESIQAIERLKKIDFPKFEDGEDVGGFVKKISQIILNEFPYLINPKIPIKSEEFLSRFFRARELELFTNINLIREHSYPPIANTKKGRCNFPKYPVFYCSDNPFTALLETARGSVYVDKSYCISKWELQNSDNTLIFENFLQTDLPEENPYIPVRDGLINNISSPFKISFNQELNKTQEEGLIEYFKFLNSAFINDENYSLSASLAHNSLYANHRYRTDVLMYPSVQTYRKGINLAIQPNCVDNCLKMKRLYIVKIYDYDTEKYTIKISILKYADVEKNIVKWKEVIPDDNEFNQLLKEDFGEITNSIFIEQENSHL